MRSPGAEIKMKYKGYIDRERVFADKMHRLENIKIKVSSTTPRFMTSQRNAAEARTHTTRNHRTSFTYSGVSPSDINVLLVLMGR